MVKKALGSAAEGRGMNEAAMAARASCQGLSPTKTELLTERLRGCGCAHAKGTVETPPQAAASQGGHPFLPGAELGSFLGPHAMTVALARSQCTQS